MFVIIFRKCEEFYKIPGNDKCCDCGSEEPRWASINLGITLCIACSGVHRSLGVHYSKVRSLTLDGWEPEIVKVMMELGNNAINDIYEANYIESSVNRSDDESQSTQVRRATSDCDIAVREAWIKTKYIDKAFVISTSLINADYDTVQKRSSTLRDIILNKNGWFVRQSRRTRIKLRTTEKTSAASATEKSSDGSELSIDSNQTSDDLSFGSDNSTDDEDEDLSHRSIDGNLDDFTSDMILFKATNKRNLPVMCYALASGASKGWANPMDLERSALHQAILSVSLRKKNTIELHFSYGNNNKSQFSFTEFSYGM